MKVHSVETELQIWNLFLSQASDSFWSEAGDTSGGPSVVRRGHLNHSVLL